MELIFSKDTSYLWEESMLYNQTLIKRCEEYFKQRLLSRGFIFLGEIKYNLGMKVAIEDYDYVCIGIENWSFGCIWQDEGVLKLSVYMSKR